MTLKISKAEYDQMIAAARLFDEFWRELHVEETMRRQWINGSDGYFYYVSPVERAEAVMQ